MHSIITYTLRDHIAVVTLDLPGEKVNILTGDFLRAMEEVALRLAAERDLKGAVVLSSKETGFIAGADIEEIASVKDPLTGTRLAQKGQGIINLWSKLPFPIVAAIHGHCIGGGTEFALACSARLSSPDAQFSLPEVKLGIFPGFGGTQRLPRLVGLESALDMVLSGRTVGAQEALRIGLIDRISTGDLLSEALALASELAESPEKLKNENISGRKVLRRLLLEENPLGRAVLFRRARIRVMTRTKGHYPAPLKALEVIRRGTALTCEEGLDLEVQEIGPLLASGVCKNLLHVFSLAQRPKKENAGRRKGIKVRRAAVLGAGVMGVGISHLLISREIQVVLRDVRQEAVESALEQVRRLLQGKRRKLSDTDKRRLELITGTTQLWGIKEADLIIEAVAEKMSVKEAVLQETSSHMSDGAVFATNTSALSVSELQQTAKQPEMVGGFHFFNPVHRMPLVEIVRAERTSDRTINTLFSLALDLGKIPVHVRDSPGFLVNRLLGVYLNESALMAEEGVDWKALDRLMEEFGFPMGPFRLLDEIGIDIATEAAATLVAAFPYFTTSSFLDQANSLGMTGKKDEAGFYLYKNGRSIGPNPEIERRWGKKSRHRPGVRDRRRLLYLMVNEAGRCLQEGIVSGPEDVDTGMIFGAGFPAFRGGLCRWADRTGIGEIREGPMGMAAGEKERFSPCDYLVEREAFYL